MSSQGCILIFVGLVCLISAAPTATNRQKRQSIFFEDELDEQGSPKQGISTASKSGNHGGLSRDTRAPHWNAFRAPAFGPQWGPPDFSHEHFGKGNHGGGQGSPKFDHIHNHGYKVGHSPQFHGESPFMPSQNSAQIWEFAEGAGIEGSREKRQFNGRPTSNQRPTTVAGSWNQNQANWNEVGNGPNWGNGQSWLGSGQNINGGAAWNGNQVPNGNGNNGAWNNGNNQNWNGNSNGNQRPNGNGNNGAWNGNQRPNGNGNNGAWNGNQNPGAWNNGNQRPNGNNQNSWNSGGAWNGNNQRPNGNGNNQNSWNNGNNNGDNSNASGNNGNFGNSIVPPNNNPRPSGNNNGNIRPPISITGARPPSTPMPNCDCPATAETNPVCGTDGNTYTNPSRLRCARICGRNVQMQHFGTCAATTPAPDLRRG